MNHLMEHYMWCDRHGELHSVEEMETRHLFHIVRMIWDHSVPKEHQTDFKKRYTFSEFYSKEYLALSVRLMLPVLLLRKDLEPYMIYWINFIRDKVTAEARQVPFIRMIDYAVATENSDSKTE